MRSSTLVAALLLVFVVTEVPASSPPSVLSTSSFHDTFDPVPGLTATAARLFPASVGATTPVTHVRELELFAQGYRYDGYHVLGSDSKQLGQILRYQVFLDPRTTIDLALSLEDGRIVDCSPLRPVMIEGKPFPELPKLFERLASRKMENYAGPLARFFHGMSFLEQGHAGPPPDPVPQPGAKPIVSIVQPRLSPGDACPEFSLPSYGGGRMTREMALGKPFVVVFFGLERASSRHLWNSLVPLVPKYPAVHVIPVIRNSVKEIPNLTHLVHYPAVLLPTALLDAAGSMAYQFHCRIFPWMYGFDPSGKLVVTATFQDSASVEALMLKLASLAPKDDPKKEKPR